MNRGYTLYTLDDGKWRRVHGFNTKPDAEKWGRLFRKQHNRRTRIVPTGTQISQPKRRRGRLAY